MGGSTALVTIERGKVERGCGRVDQNREQCRRQDSQHAQPRHLQNSRSVLCSRMRWEVQLLNVRAADWKMLACMHKGSTWEAHGGVGWAAACSSWWDG